MTDERRLQELARRYAAGDTTWREIADELDGVAFGDLLVELARQGLSLPTTSGPEREARMAVWEDVLQKAVDDAVEMGPTAWERDHAALKAWLAKHRGRDMTIADDPDITDEQRAAIHRAIERERAERGGEEGGDGD